MQSDELAVSRLAATLVKAIYNSHELSSLEREWGLTHPEAMYLEMLNQGCFLNHDSFVINQVWLSGKHLGLNERAQMDTIAVREMLIALRTNPKSKLWGVFRFRAEKLGRRPEIRQLVENFNYVKQLGWG
jgi:hypothetical protein